MRVLREEQDPVPSAVLGGESVLRVDVSGLPRRPILRTDAQRKHAIRETEGWRAYFAGSGLASLATWRGCIRGKDWRRCREVVDFRVTG